jgi:hypothetical protein
LLVGILLLHRHLPVHAGHRVHDHHWVHRPSSSLREKSTHRNTRDTHMQCGTVTLPAPSAAAAAAAVSAYSLHRTRPSRSESGSERVRQLGPHFPRGHLPS